MGVLHEGEFVLARATSRQYLNQYANMGVMVGESICCTIVQW